MLTALDQEYYYAKGTNHALPDVNEMISNCLIISTYLAMKQQYPSIKPISNLFINNIHFKVKFDKTPVFDMQMLGEDILNNPFIEWRVVAEEKQNEDAVYLLESCIDTFQYVLTTVFWELSPHFSHYDPQQDLNGYHSGHVCLFIHHDTEYYYLVDEPYMVQSYHKEFFEQHSLDIIKIKKKYLRHAITTSLKCYCVQLNQENMKRIRPISRQVIEEIVTTFGKTSGSGSDSYLYGKEALRELCRISNSASVSLNQNSPNVHYKKLYDYLTWKLCNLISRRYILYHYLLSNEPSYSDMPPIVMEDIHTLRRLQGIYRRNYLRGKDIWDDRYTPIYEKIIQIESTLVDRLICLC